MAILNVIATGSKGNAYLVESEGKKILLDCGVNEKSILRALDYNLLDLCGVLVTHEHDDHAHCVSKLQNRFVDVYGPDTIKAIEVEPLIKYRCKVGHFMFMPFDLPHDGVRNYGYYVELPDGETLLYATDYSYIPYRFNKPINHFLIECNYMVSDLDKEEEKYSHVVRGHAGMNTVIAYLHMSVTTETKSITLCHMTQFSDHEGMRQAAQIAFPDVKVYAAEAGEFYEI